MASRVTLKAVNDELEKQGVSARLAKAKGYFLFEGGEAAEWLDRTVQVDTIGAHSVEEWILEFRRLQQRNAEMLAEPAAAKPPAKRTTRRAR